MTMTVQGSFSIHIYFNLFKIIHIAMYENNLFRMKHFTFVTNSAQILAPRHLLSLCRSTRTVRQQLTVCDQQST
jgi:hypothetical protein